MSLINDPRAKLLIANHGRSVMIALTVLGVLALAVAVTIALTPPTTTAVEWTDEETITTSGAHSAEIVAGDSWEEGTVLEDSSTYLIEDSPVVDIEVTATGPEGTSVSHELVLVVEADRDGEVFWSDEEVLLEAEETVEDDEATAVASIDIAALAERLEDRRDGFSGVGSVETTVHLRTEYDTGLYEGELADESTLEVTDRAYWFESDLADSDDRDQTVQTEQVGSPNWLGVSLAGLVGLLFLTGAWTVRATNPEEMDIAAIKQEIHFRRYADWISKGRIPMWVGNNYVELESLEDVVDVAIDTDQRAIYDGQRDLFAVINGEVVYYYSKVGDWEQGAWPTLNLPSADEPVDVTGTATPPGRGMPDDSGGSDTDEDGDGEDEPEEWDKDVWRNL